MPDENIDERVKREEQARKRQEEQQKEQARKEQPKNQGNLEQRVWNHHLGEFGEKVYGKAKEYSTFGLTAAASYAAIGIDSLVTGGAFMLGEVISKIKNKEKIKNSLPDQCR